MENQLNIPLHQRLNADQIVGSDCNEESYDRMPVSSFGSNLLKSMGWYEGRGIGRNPRNALLKPIEYVPNYDRAGLGARKDAPNLKKRKTEEISQDENGKIKHYIEVGEKSSAKPKKLEKNSRIKIIDGKYKGLGGIVVDLYESKKECYVELDINEKIVKLEVTQVKLDESKSIPSEEIHFEREDDENPSNQNIKDDGFQINEKKKEKKREKKKLKWIQPHIMVKVISKKVRDGKLYEKKVYISDVLDQYTFIAIDEKKNVIDDLREKDVETVMPKSNGHVKILVGENKGKIGMLLMRDKKKNKIQVQLVDTMDIEEYTQDDCSQYIEKF